MSGGARRAQSQAGFLSNWPLEDVVYSEDSRFKDRLGRKKASKGSLWDHLSLGESLRGGFLGNVGRARWVGRESPGSRRPALWP